MLIRSTVVHAICLCAFIAITAAAPAHAESILRIRPLTSRLADLLAHGYRTSPTLASIVDALERSDVIVHIEEGILRDMLTIGETRLVVRAGGQRYLRITLDPRIRNHAAIALLAHELQHAREIADRPWVIDQSTVERLYREIGHSTGPEFGAGRFDTPAGAEAARRVRLELN